MKRKNKGTKDIQLAENIIMIYNCEEKDRNNNNNNQC